MDASLAHANFVSLHTTEFSFDFFHFQTDRFRTLNIFCSCQSFFLTSKNHTYNDSMIECCWKKAELEFEQDNAIEVR
jgi:hypothetical protein